MTQVVRQKWVLLVASANAVLALVLMAVVAVGLSAGQRGAQEAAARREAEVREVREGLERLHGLPAAIEELRADGLRRAAAPASSDPQLTQTLQLVASEQQLLLLRSMEPAKTPPPVPAKVVRRSARRARPLRRTACALPEEPSR
jgi:C4-dicarboxylate-specific signal transduction histidine kinase